MASTKPRFKKKLIILVGIIGVGAIAGVLTLNQQVHPMKPPVLDPQTGVLQRHLPLVDGKPAHPPLAINKIDTTVIAAKPPVSTPSPLSQKAEETAAITILQNASQGVAMAVSTFSGPDGLVGIVYQAPSPEGGYLHGLAWVIPAKKLIFLGDLINAQGNMIAGPSQFMLHTLRHPLPPASAASPATPTASAASSATTPPIAVATSAIGTTPASLNTPASLVSGSATIANPASYLTAYNDGNSVKEGYSGPLVTVFFDPNSESAFALYKELSAEAHQGKIQVRWVPVAIKGQTSLQRAEYILTAPSPMAALRLNFNNYDVRLHQGGAPLLSNMNMMSQVDQNTAILSIIGHPDPLVLFYCDGKTNSVLPLYKPQLTFSMIQKLMPNMGYHCH